MAVLQSRHDLRKRRPGPQSRQAFDSCDQNLRGRIVQSLCQSLNRNLSSGGDEDLYCFLSCLYILTLRQGLQRLVRCLDSIPPRLGGDARPEANQAAGTSFHSPWEDSDETDLGLTHGIPPVVEDRISDGHDALNPFLQPHPEERY